MLVFIVVKNTTIHKYFHIPSKNENMATYKTLFEYKIKLDRHNE